MQHLEFYVLDSGVRRGTINPSLESRRYPMIKRVDLLPMYSGINLAALLPVIADHLVKMRV